MLHSLNQLLVHNDWLEDPLLFYEQIAEYLFLGLLLLVIAVSRGVGGLSWRRAAVAAGLSAGIALGIGKVVSTIVDRPRPFVSHPHLVHLFAPHAPDPGFPSDHATASFAIALAVMLRSRRWGTIVLIAAAILSVGRVALGYHYPTDIIGGAVLGCAVALLLWWPPLRRQVERMSDFAGGLWDRLLAWLAGLGRPAKA